MKKYFITCLVIAFCAMFIHAGTGHKQKLKEGDIVFQIPTSQYITKAKIITKSPYPRCGIVFKQDRKFYVLTIGMENVERISLRKWIRQGEGCNYIVKRLIESKKIGRKKLEKMREIAYGLIGKQRSYAMEWSEERYYSAELVWKIYKQGAGIELCPTTKLGDLDLNDKEIYGKMKDLYGKDIPFNETIIKPADIFESPLLVTVYKR